MVTRPQTTTTPTLSGPHDPTARTGRPPSSGGEFARIRAATPARPKPPGARLSHPPGPARPGRRPRPARRRGPPPPPAPGRSTPPAPRRPPGRADGRYAPRDRPAVAAPRQGARAGPGHPARTASDVILDLDQPAPPSRRPRTATERSGVNGDPSPRPTSPGPARDAPDVGPRPCASRPGSGQLCSRRARRRSAGSGSTSAVLEGLGRHRPCAHTRMVRLPGNPMPRPGSCRGWHPAC